MPRIYRKKDAGNYYLEIRAGYKREYFTLSKNYETAKQQAEKITSAIKLRKGNGILSAQLAKSALLNNEEGSNNSSITIAALKERICTHLKSLNRRPRTIELYDYILSLFENTMTEKKEEQNEPAKCHTAIGGKVRCITQPDSIGNNSKY